MTAAPAILEAHGLRKTYRVKRGLFRPPAPLVAVDGVDLAIGRDEIIGIVGESGCGKSTLARLLLGLEAAGAGEVRLEGRPIAALSRLERARMLQPVFQDPYSSLNPRRSVASIVGVPLRVHRLGDRAEQRRRVLEMLDVVGLPRRLADSYPGQLSGGQRQRVAIARALVMRPEVLVCDEPTSALDVSVQAQILNLLLDLYREFGLTIILISHDLGVVEHLARRVMVMYLGRIVEAVSAEQLFRAPRHPYTQALLASVLTPEPGLGLPDARLGALPPNPLDIPPGCRFHPRCPWAWDDCARTTPRTLALPDGLVECHLHDPAMKRPDAAGDGASRRPGAESQPRDADRPPADRPCPS